MLSFFVVGFVFTYLMINYAFHPCLKLSEEDEEEENRILYYLATIITPPNRDQILAAQLLGNPISRTKNFRSENK